MQSYLTNIIVRWSKYNEAMLPNCPFLRNVLELSKMISSKEDSLEMELDNEVVHGTIVKNKMMGWIQKGKITRQVSGSCLRGQLSTSQPIPIFGCPRCGPSWRSMPFLSYHKFGLVHTTADYWGYSPAVVSPGDYGGVPLREVSVTQSPTFFLERRSSLP